MTAAQPWPAHPALRARGTTDFVNRAACGLVLALVAYLPYAETLSDRLPWQLLEYSAWVTVLPTLLVLFVFIGIGLLRKPVLLWAPGTLAVAAVVVLYLRLTWGIAEGAGMGKRAAVGIRYFVLFPLYIALARYTTRTGWFRRAAGALVLINGIVAAAAGILYATALTQYRVRPGTPEDVMVYMTGVRTRASGLFAGVNVYGNFLVVAILLCAFDRKLRFWTRAAVLGILAAGVIVSESRCALLMTVLILSAALWMRRLPMWRRLLQVAGLASALFGAQALVSESTTSMGSRISESFEEDVDIRLAKYRLAVDALAADPQTVLAGVPSSSLALGASARLQFSDNSFLTVLTSAGLPAGILFFWLAALGLRSMENPPGKPPIKVFWIVIGATMLVNNAIVWDIWLLHVAIAFGLVAREGAAAAPVRIKRRCVGSAA